MIDVTVGFAEKGLPNGSVWSVGAGSPVEVRSATVEGPSSTIQFSEPPGRLFYSIHSPPGYSPVSIVGPRYTSLFFSDLSKNTTLHVRFAPTESLTFAPLSSSGWPGIPTAVGWGVTMDPTSISGPAPSWTYNFGGYSIPTDYSLPWQEGSMSLAVDNATDRLFVLNQGTRSVAAVNTSSNELVGQVEVGYAPIAIGVDVRNGLVYVANTGSIQFVSNNVSIINGTTLQRVGNVSLPGAPTALLVDPVTNRVYVASGNGLGNWITVINGTSNSATSFFLSIPAIGLAVNVASGVVFVIEFSKYSPAGYVLLLNPANDSVASSVQIGGRPTGWAVDPGTDTLFVVGQPSASGGTNALYIINTTSFAFPESFNVSLGMPYYLSPASIAFDSVHDAVYVGFTPYSYFERGAVAVYNGSTGAIERTVPLGTGAYPYLLVADPINQVVYCSGDDGNGLTVLTESAEPSITYLPIAPNNATIVGPSGSLYAAVAGVDSLIVVPGVLQWSSDVLFQLPRAGAFSYQVVTEAWETSSPTHGRLQVASHSVVRPVRFKLRIDPFVFRESGLPSGWSWTVRLTGSTNLQKTSQAHRVKFLLPNATYNWSIQAPAGFAANPGSGSFNLSFWTDWFVIQVNFTITGSSSGSPAPPGSLPAVLDGPNLLPSRSVARPR